ncbi:hypothetical protein BDZ45DRAFT_181155 [Acephala macrosclerotiorum]|nr:hypothetical protein BDZ45DRAFT_181155 [Acephala macrosclerotiorum]
MFGLSQNLVQRRGICRLSIFSQQFRHAPPESLTKAKRNKFVRPKTQISQPQNLLPPLIFDSRITNHINSFRCRCGMDKSPKEPRAQNVKVEAHVFQPSPKRHLTFYDELLTRVCSNTKATFLERATEFYYAKAAVHVRAPMSYQLSSIYSTLFESFSKKIPTAKLAFENSEWRPTI